MRTKMLTGMLALLVLAALVAPASAINVGGTEFVFLAENRIGFESGPTVIVGNVGVSSPTGVMDVGSNVRIMGRAIANRINVSSGAVIDVCEFNTKTGPGTCLTEISPFPGITPWPPIAIPPLPACVDAAATPNVTVPAGTTQNLAPGCYKVVTVGQGATLNLVAGNYDVQQLQLQNSATIDGAGPTATIVSSKKVITVLPNSVITDIRIQTPLGPTSSEVIQIGNGTQVDNSLLYGPFGKAHVHTASFGSGSEVVARTLHIEVVDFVSVPPESCPCIQSATKVGGTTISLTGVGLSSPPTNFFLSLGCDCPGAGCTAATPVAGGSDTAVDLTIPGGLPAGNYHVVAQGTSGTFCTADLITIP